MNKIIQITFVSFVIVFFVSNLVYSQSGVNEIFSEDLEESGYVELGEWKGMGGDNFQWLNDSLSIERWEPIEPDFISEQELTGWQGTGWFKTKVKVDQSLTNKPVALKFSEHSGASEIYINGSLIFRLGTISSIPEQNSSQKQSLPRFIQFADTTDYEIVVRYRNMRYSDFNRLGITSGFSLAFIDYDFFLAETKKQKIQQKYIISIIVFLISLSIVHLLFLIFYPSGQKNFYFTFLAASVALFTCCKYVNELFVDPEYSVFAFYGKHIAWVITILCVLKFAYLFKSKNKQVVLVGFLLISLIIAVLSMFSTLQLSLIISIVSFVALLEFSRVMILEKIREAPVDLILWGIFGLIVLGVTVDSSSLEFWEAGFPILNSTNGITLLTASISFFLLRDFAKAQIKLEHKYLEVKHLSDRSIDQEKRNKEKEFQQKLLEAENERKTAELEEARALQLSMLPAILPTSKYWDIAAKMETAYEVGGDYYDFYESSKDEFVVAVGDATGHGMKAGIIVATVKSIFHSSISSSTLTETLRSISSGIRNLDLKMLYMGLMLLKVKGHKVTFTSAGMPQSFWYKAKSETIEEVILKAMPLGVKVDFPYTEIEMQAEEGDILFCISDGLTELFNEQRELLGVEPITELLKKEANKSPQEILNSFIELKSSWSGKAPQEDDVTILILKAK
ncbi:MAG: SpoIIE family protein phosphatase [Balneolales bacterium]|nr:SpoIIE family protein phosphatase [Balneolales bacterium]